MLIEEFTQYLFPLWVEMNYLQASMLYKNDMMKGKEVPLLYDQKKASVRTYNCPYDC